MYHFTNNFTRNTVPYTAGQSFLIAGKFLKCEKMPQPYPIPDAGQVSTSFREGLSYIPNRGHINRYIVAGLDLNPSHNSST